MPIRILLFDFSESALSYRLLNPRVLQGLCGLEALVRLPLEAACEERDQVGVSHLEDQVEGLAAWLPHLASRVGLDYRVVVVIEENFPTSCLGY